jgi:hypothetical protein
MERVFASQLAAWRHAQQQGLSLADHVLAGRASRSFEAIDLTTEMEPELESTWPSAILHDVEIATPPSFPAAVPGRRRWPRAVLMVLAVPLVIVAGILLRGSDTTSQRLPAGGDVVSAPMPITPTPVAAPENAEVVVDPPAPPAPPAAAPRAKARPKPRPPKKPLTTEELDAPLPP